MQPGLNDAPYKRSYESLLEMREWHAATTVAGQTIREGDQFWHTEEHYMITIEDVVEMKRLDNRGNEMGDGGPVKICFKSNKPDPTPVHLQSAGGSDIERMNAETFVDELDDGVWQSHCANGRTPRMP